MKNTVLRLLRFQLLHNPHKDVPRHPFLINAVCQQRFFLRIAQKSALYNDDGACCFFQKIVAVIRLCLPMVLRVKSFYQALLQAFCKLLSLDTRGIIKNLRPFDRRIGLAVLVNTDRKIRLCLFHHRHSPLHILHFFPGRIFIIQTVIVRSRHYNRNIRLL